MHDVQLAERLDELLRAARSGLPFEPGQFDEGLEDPEDRRLLDFFAQLVRAANEWRAPSCAADATEDSASDTPLAPPTGAGPEEGGPCFGRYRVLNRIAAGGMGTVYRAHDPTLGRTVAVKVPHLDPEHPRFEQLAEQFVQEARLAASVDHPNVCMVYDAGRHEGTPYAVMAFVEGATLAAKLRVDERFEDPLAAAAFVCRVAEGVNAAHRRKIVHRDIKPGNILIRASDGVPLLTDFGLARITEDGGNVTRPGVVAGTVAYMAPEQAAGDTARIGPATDVYALGAVLYQMVTGRLPFEGDAPTALKRIRSASAAPDPTHARPDLDPRLAAVIRRAMAPDPRDRYPDAGGLASALATLAGPSDAATATYNAPAGPPPGRRSRRWVLAGGVLAVAGGLAGWRYLGPAPTAAPPLDGDLVVRVWTNPEAIEPNAWRKEGIAVDDKQRNALPVRNIDFVHIEVRLNRPAYAYLLWFPGEGGPPSPLFPWNPDPNVGFRMRPEQKRVTELHSPERRDGGWEVSGPSGLETAVLLAREEPLGANELAALEAEIGKLPATPLGHDLKEVAWLWREQNRPDAWTSRGTLRGIKTEQSRDLVDEPVFALLRRLQAKFDLVKAVRFAHAGDDLPPPADSRKE